MKPAMLAISIFFTILLLYNLTPNNEYDEIEFENIPFEECSVSKNQQEPIIFSDRCPNDLFRHFDIDKNCEVQGWPFRISRFFIKGEMYTSEMMAIKVFCNDMASWELQPYLYTYSRENGSVLSLANLLKNKINAKCSIFLPNGDFYIDSSGVWISRDERTMRDIDILMSEDFSELFEPCH